ncbi:MAG TPA: hypothetical protein VGI92_14590 [Gemmatimonadales bacterium]
MAAIAYGVNRVNCGIVNNGTNCVDPTGSPVNENGFWPKGTQDNYVFNSGLQIAGFIPNISGFTWSGDTIGAFFFDPRGDQHHGEGITNIFNGGNSDDLNNWPAAGFANDTGLYHPVLLGRKTISQQDLWVRYWDGNPSLATGRKHSMGLLVDQRISGWNFPAGNNDIIYVIVRFINITSGQRSDYDGLSVYGYAATDIDDIFALAQNWRATASAAYNVQIPIGGFPWTNLYASYAEDPDIGDASANYSNGNLIFNTVAAYKSDFHEATWLLPPSIFAAPFAAAPGFMAIKYLATPGNLGITMSGNTTNGGAFPDAVGVPRLWRNLSGNLLATDGTCNVTPPQTRHQCYWAQAASDTRMFAASGPFSINPGALATTVVAMVWAAPVATLPAATPGANVAANATISSFTLQNFINAGNMVPGFAIDPVRLRQNQDTVRSMDRAMGFVNYSDANNDAIIEQNEVTTVPRSLLNKELVAQAVFNNKFLLPFAPEAPGFFLVPGDGSVTVAWQKSSSETTGNPFFAVSSLPLINGVPNPLYDPNFRQFDTEGYRIYRGRTQAEMAVIASFDYAGTAISDYTAEFYDPTIYGNACAPELAITTTCPRTYALAPDNATYVTTTTPVPINLAGSVLQIPPGGRVALANGTVFNVQVDTAVTGGGSGLPPLTDNGVPFAFVDNTVLNGVRYFYAVTAFMVNSLKSGPSSLESPLVTKTIIPRVSSGQEVSGTSTFQLLGRGTTPLDPTAPVPAIDAATGEFAGPMPPTNGIVINFAAFVPFAAASSVSLTIDSIIPGAGPTLLAGVNGTYWVTATSPTGSVKVAIPILVDGSNIPASATYTFPPVAFSTALAAPFGGDSTFTLNAQATISVPGAWSLTSQGRGGANAAPAGAVYNAPRWWGGSANENTADPNGTSCAALANGCIATSIARTAGSLPGIDSIFAILSYRTVSTNMRAAETVTDFVTRAADFTIYWGAAGVVDSVIDVTHNVVVPFNAKIRASWGILNDSSFTNTPAAASSDGTKTTLTWSDVLCVDPIPTFTGECSGVSAATSAFLMNHVVLSPTVFKPSSGAGTAVPAYLATTAPGFIFFIDGHFFAMEPTGGSLTTCCTATTSHLRVYAGAVTGSAAAANFAFVPATRPPAVPGLTAEIAFTPSSFNAAVSNDSLMKSIHTVPDPYYVTTSLEQTVNTKILRFVNLPSQAIIRIYSASGILVNIVTHNDPTGGGEAVWDLRNRNNQFVASGVYFYHVEAPDGRTKIGRFTVVNFAQ